MLRNPFLPADASAKLHTPAGGSPKAGSPKGGSPSSPRPRRLMSPEERAALRQKHYNATVVALKHVHSDLVIMRVAPDFSVPLHKPGQYSTLGMGRWEPRAAGCQEEEAKPAEDTKLIRRAYSLSCSVLDDAGQFIDVTKTGWLEFYIVLVRESDKAPPA